MNKLLNVIQEVIVGIVVLFLLTLGVLTLGNITPQLAPTMMLSLIIGAMLWVILKLGR